MGDEADWAIERAMFGGCYDYDGDDSYGVENGDFKPRRSRGFVPGNSAKVREILNRRFWIDGKLNKVYPEKPPHAGGMESKHIQAVKAHLVKLWGAERVHGTPLWKALCAGEEMHEGELRKAKDLNKGVIQW